VTPPAPLTRAQAPPPSYPSHRGHHGRHAPDRPLRLGLNHHHRLGFHLLRPAPRPRAPTEPPGTRPAAVDLGIAVFEGTPRLRAADHRALVARLEALDLAEDGVRAVEGDRLVASTGGSAVPVPGLAVAAGGGAGGRWPYGAAGIGDLPPGLGQGARVCVPDAAADAAHPALAAASPGVRLFHAAGSVEGAGGGFGTALAGIVAGEGGGRPLIPRGG